MNLNKLPYIKDVVKNHINGDADLLDIYKPTWNIDNLGNLLEKHSFSIEERKVLVNVLKEQYKELGLSDDDEISKNIELLKQPNTFTITTGQQIHPFLGPMYVLYKISSAINLAKKLKKKYTDINFIPIFWMATEDHDFEEIRTLKLFGKEYKWECEHGGVVGKLDCGSLAPLLVQMENDFSELKEDVFFQNAKQYYKKGVTLADASRRITNNMFKNTGLLCLDADNKALKQLFLEEMKAEIETDNAHHLININSQKLKKFIKKLPVNSHRTNLFYLADNSRNRIDEKNGLFYVKGTDKKMSKSLILDDIASNPQNYSPNVCLRPLYQEKILPSIAYIAGPTEYIYWMQLGKIFNNSRLATPILLHRNSVFIRNKNMDKKIDKMGFTIEDFFGVNVEELSAGLKRKITQDFDMAETTKNIQKSIGDFRDKWFELDSKVAKENLETLKYLSKTVKGLEAKYQKSIFNAPEMANKLTYIDKILGMTLKGSIQERNTPIFQQLINNKNIVEKIMKASESQCFNEFLIV